MKNEKKCVLLYPKTQRTMIRRRTLLVLIMTTVTAMAVVACNRSKAPEESIADTMEAVDENYFTEPDTTPTPEVELSPVEPKPAPRVVKKEPVKEEVLYISGHGANGRVWGHITMKGDKGYGSVTDEHENALTCNCTRQGEELICYDQNSRQYIFRL